MAMQYSIRALGTDEIEQALCLTWKVFQEYEAPDYTKEGVEEFYKSIHNKDYLSELCFYGAFSQNDLIGVIATRKEGRHIALFFVEGAYHRQGIGRKLFDTIWSNCLERRMTVNSSPYAVPVYHRLGFKDTDVEQEVNGVRFTPMERQ